MTWPPKAGDRLPRAEDVWCHRTKMENWVLGAEGHGREWDQVFGVGPGQWLRVWEAIARSALGAVIVEVRHHPIYGVSCGITVDLTLRGRTAPIVSSWHYADRNAAPRLVTAY